MQNSYIKKVIKKYVIAIDKKTTNIFFDELIKYENEIDQKRMHIYKKNEIDLLFNYHHQIKYR